MKKTTKILAFASAMSVFLLVGQSSFVLAQETAVVEEAQGTQEVSGKVVSVNTEASTIVVEYVGGAEQLVEIGEFQLNEETEIMLDETEASLADVIAGDQVSVVYIENEVGQKVIDMLKITRS
jgi:hypothetical protein